MNIFFASSSTNRSKIQQNAMKKLILFVLVIFLSLRFNTAKKPLMSIILQKCTSYCNPEYCKIKTVCRPLNRTSKFVSMDIYFHPGVKLNAPYVEIQTFRKFATVYRPIMVKLRFEFCKEIAMKTHPIFSLTKNHSCYGNLCDPCPISGRRYTTPRITNAYDYVIDPIPIVPAGEWNYNITVLHERNGSEVVVVWWSDYYEIKTLTAEQF